MEILSIIGGTLFGLIFSITPIPYLPMMYIQGARETWEKDHSIGWLLFFLIANILWPLFPIVMIFGAFIESPLGGIALTAAMYYPLWGIKDKEEEYDNDSTSE